MSDPNPWYARDKFWELFEPILFDQQRQSSAREEAERVAGLLNIQKYDRILDLCCGTGRHSLAFASLGFAVVGVDLTESFIKKARQRAEERDLQVDFVVADMKAYFQADGYDIVVNLFGSFGYFEDPADDQQVIRNMHASLRAGGRILLETMGKELAARDFRERDWSEHGDTLVLAERKPTQDWSRIQTRWILISGGSRFEQTVSLRSFSALELKSLLSENGFVDVQVYGDLEGNAYDHASKRLVVIGTKGKL